MSEYKIEKDYFKSIIKLNEIIKASNVNKFCQALNDGVINDEMLKIILSRLYTRTLMNYYQTDEIKELINVIDTKYDDSSFLRRYILERKQFILLILECFKDSNFFTQGEIKFIMQSGKSRLLYFLDKNFPFLGFETNFIDKYRNAFEESNELYSFTKVTNIEKAIILSRVYIYVKYNKVDESEYHLDNQNLDELIKRYNNDEKFSRFCLRIYYRYIKTSDYDKEEMINYVCKKKAYLNNLLRIYPFLLIECIEREFKRLKLTKK